MKRNPYFDRYIPTHVEAIRVRWPLSNVPSVVIWFDQSSNPKIRRSLLHPRCLSTYHRGRNQLDKHTQQQNVPRSVSYDSGGNCPCYRSRFDCPAIEQRNIFLQALSNQNVYLEGSKSYVLEGWSVTAGIECMWGSAIYLITTGISKSHALIVLSSEVVTNRRFSSTKVIVLTGPKCWSYSWVISPEFMSYYKWYRNQHQAFEKRDKTDLHLYNFLIWHAGKEYMLLVFIGMEAYDIRNLAVAEPFQTLPSFCIP